jgi:hypothetical protein
MNSSIAISGAFHTLASISSWIESVDGDGRVFLIMMFLGAAAMLIGFSIRLINNIHRRNAEIAFKRDLLDRGLSVDEIERLLGANMTDAKPKV